MTTAAEHRERTVLAWTEKQFQQQIIGLARTLGWRVYHPYDSRRSVPGFPDLVLVHPARGVLWRELKTEKGRASPAQHDWLHALIEADQDATIWRPRHWNDGTIHQALGAATPRDQHQEGITP